MKTKIYIHIGYPKTGTTTLQKHFFPNIQEIEYIGKFVDRDSNFYTNVINQIIFKDINHLDTENILNALVKRKEKTILLSEEDFLFDCLRPPSIAEDLFQATPIEIANKLRLVFNKEEFDVEIILTIRKQDEMLTSLYAQAYTFNYSKYKEYDTFNKFVNVFIEDQYSNNKLRKGLDYLETVSIYKSIFGNNSVHVLLYEELQDTPKIFYTKLCSILKISISEYRDIAIKKVENKRSNQKGYKKVYNKNLLHILRSFKKEYFPKINFKLTKRQKLFLESISFSNKKVENTIKLTKRQKEMILNTYKVSNEKLSLDINYSLSEFGYYNV